MSEKECQACYPAVCDCEPESAPCGQFECTCCPWWRAQLEKVMRERDGWLATASQWHRDIAYYRELVDRVATFLGHDVFVSDDGSVQDRPLRAKVPEMVEHLAKERDALRALVEKAKRYLTHEGGCPGYVDECNCGLREWYSETSKC